MSKMMKIYCYHQSPLCWCWIFLSVYSSIKWFIWYMFFFLLKRYWAGVHEASCCPAHSILKDNIASPTLCGFCEKSTCSVSLTNTSKKKGVKHYKVQSTCDYNYQFNLKSAKKSSKRMPCCNRPIFCPFQYRNVKCTRVI